jgi:hypothetical protein
MSSGSTALCFHAFAWQLLTDAPHAILLECTPGFEEHNLQIFEEAYVVQCLDFSPTQLGLPSARPRKYMMLLRREQVCIARPFDEAHFGAAFYRSCDLNSAAYLCVPDSERYERVIQEFRARRGLPMECCGRPWLLQEVLPPGMAARLQEYVSMAQQRGLRDGWVNIMQTPQFMRSIPQVVPTLLQGSVLYNLRQEKVMVASEHLLVMGIATEGHGIPGVATFPCRIRRSAASGQRRQSLHEVTESAVKRMCGNGMHVAAVGTCLLHLLGQTFRGAGPSEPGA